MRAALLALVVAMAVVGTATNASASTYYVSKQQLEATINAEGLTLHVGKFRVHSDVYQLACTGVPPNRGGRYHVWRCAARSARTGKWTKFVVHTHASGDSWSWTWDFA
jgi:hypothetical protein